MNAGTTLTRMATNSTLGARVEEKVKDMSTLLDRASARATARASEFNEATAKTLASSQLSQAIRSPTDILLAKVRSYGAAMTVGAFVGAAVTSGVLAGLAAFAAYRSPHIRAALDEASRLARGFIKRSSSDDDDAEGDADGGGDDVRAEVAALRDRVARLEEQMQPMLSWSESFAYGTPAVNQNAA